MKLFAITCALGALTTIFAVFGPKDLIDKHAAKLKEANSLTATFTVQQLPGNPETYTLTYSKPNLMMVDGPKKIIETDGKMLWEYDKASKTYTESPVTEKTLAAKSTEFNVWLWSAFFSADTLKNLDTLTAGSARVIKGNAVTEVNFAAVKPNPWQGTIFIDNKLGIARGMSVKQGSQETLVMASKLEPSADTLPVGQFAFSPPAGATKAVAVVAPVDTSGDVSYASVEPILKGNCINCHNTDNAKGRFSVSSYEEVTGGRAVVPGNPAASSLVGYIEGTLRPRMPKGGAPLPSSDIEKIKAWIKAGAKK